MRTLFLLLLLFLPSHGVKPTYYYPNLRVLSELLVNELEIENTPNGYMMWMSFGGYNTGPGHLIALGRRENQNIPVLLGSQVVGASDGKWYMVQEDLAGAFEWHSEPHNHWHWDSWGMFGAMRVDKPGFPLEVCTKSSFCLMNTGWGPFEFPAPGQKRVPVLPEFLHVEGKGSYIVSCQSGNKHVLSMAQAISSGRFDYYSPKYNAPIPFHGDGTYVLFGIVDPHEKIIEWHEEDNFAVAIIEIKNRKLSKVIWTYDP